MVFPCVNQHGDGSVPTCPPRGQRHFPARPLEHSRNVQGCSEVAEGPVGLCGNQTEEAGWDARAVLQQWPALAGIFFV